MRRRGIERAASLGVAVALAAGAPALAQYREYYLRGRVVDVGKQPVAGVEIELRDVATSRTFNLKTGKDGAFKFAGLPHGIYKASFAKDGYAPRQDEWKFESPQDSMQRVEIPDVVLASRDQVQKAEQGKAIESETRGAAEKVRQGDFGGAIPELEGLIRKDPGNANALFFLGLSYAGQRMYPEAIAALTKVTELQPAFPGAHFELGVCHQGLHDTPRALAAFEKSLELDPSNADAAYDAGLILFEMNRIDEALSHFEQGLTSRPQDADLLEMAGRCYIHQAKLERALESLQKARGATTDAAKAAFLDELIAKLKAGK
jgi:tetratricopeptide (TPR) repeat protein